MRAPISVMLVSSSCSLLFPSLATSPCDPAAPPRCDGKTLIVCDPGLQAELREVCNDECHEDFGGFCGACGDGDVDPNEQCDDGNLLAFDNCDPNCTIPACGNGFVLDVNGSEECDDGNLIDGDGCDSNCTNTRCGNFIITEGEACDDGIGEGPDCNDDCTINLCGDGVLDAGEQCDDQNRSDGDGCTSRCQLPGCGDGFADLNFGEECDPGDPNQLCNDDCTLPLCGDGSILFQSPEGCDDGNNVNGDGCDNNCQPSGCNNGVTLPGELCYLSARLDATTFVGALPGNVVVADFDGDGLPDLIDGQGASLVLVKNRGDGTFALSQEVAALNIGFDVLNDGMLLSAGDINNDGDTDLLFADALLPRGEVFLHNGSGVNPSLELDLVENRRDQMFLSDIDLDGNLDLITVRRPSLQIFKGDGSGAFQAPLAQTLSFGAQPFFALGDLNGDLIADLVFADASNSLALAPGGANGFGPPTTLSLAARAFQLGDWDLDGAVDLLLFGADDVSLALGNGDGTFQPEQVLLADVSATSALADDLDQDGDLDLVVRNEAFGASKFPALEVYLGDGGGAPSFAGESVFGELGGPGIAQLGAADLLPGGALEIFVVDFDGFLHVLRVL